MEGFYWLNGGSIDRLTLQSQQEESLDAVEGLVTAERFHIAIFPWAHNGIDSHWRAWCSSSDCRLSSERKR